jgi:predicted DNA-binding protein YlxM (UPF0122 family)
MRYEKVRKTDRNTDVIKKRKENPDMSLREIAEYFNISRQRVHAIIRRYNEPIT